jgi:diguanylate cyclase (GGDEF)-like protein
VGGDLRAVLTRLDRAPTVSTPSVLARSTALLYVIADLFILFAMLSQWPVVASPWRALALNVLTLLIGVLIWCRGARWRRGTYHLLLVGSAVLVSAAIVSSPGGATAVALSSILALVSVQASFFFRFRLALGHLVVTLVACSIALWSAGGVTLADYVLVSGLIVNASGIVAWLTRLAADTEIDALTGLVNRRGLDRLLDEQLNRTDQGAGLVLAMLDIDYFKAVNDAAGHAEGDRLLREATRAWQDTLDPRHVLARVGGDEFIVLLRDHDRAGADRVADGLMAALGERTCTIGLAQWERGDSAAMLQGRADAALYAGKRNGRSQARWHETVTGALSEPLHGALESGHLRVYYQPIVDLATERILGAEALVRWPDGSGGWVDPATFIPTAEATGMIHRLGGWVLQQACVDAMTWVEAGRPVEKLSVNVSPIQLQDAEFPALVQRVLTESGFDPSALMLEVTESAIGADGARANQSLAELRALGVRVAIDDFGTGYSTLSRLRDVPIDVLKIDRSFVATLAAEDSHAPIVGAVVALAGALGLGTVAEGVETPEHARMLISLGCRQAQGFLYSPAVPTGRLLGLWEPGVDAGLAAQPAAA